MDGAALLRCASPGVRRDGGLHAVLRFDAPESPQQSDGARSDAPRRSPRGFDNLRGYRNRSGWVMDARLAALHHLLVLVPEPGTAEVGEKDKTRFANC